MSHSAQSAISGPGNRLLDVLCLPYRYQAPAWFTNMSLEEKAKLWENCEKFTAANRYLECISFIKETAGPSFDDSMVATTGRIFNTDIWIPQDAPFIRAACDVWRHCLPLDNLIHVPRLPLTRAHFSVEELHQRNDSLKDLFIKYNRGFVIFDPSVAMALYDIEHDHRDFELIVHTQALGCYDVLPYVPSNGQDPDSEEGILELFQKTTFQHMAALNLPMPTSFDGHWRSRLFVNHFYTASGQHLVPYTEASAEEQAEARNLYKEQRSAGVPKYIAAATVLCKNGLVVPWACPSMNSGIEAPSPIRSGISGHIQRLSIAQAEGDVHARLAQDKRFLFGMCSPEDLLLRTLRQSGIINLQMHDRLKSIGEYHGCCYPGCIYHLKSMCRTGVSDGVWVFDPLQFCPTNLIACRLHFQIATLLTDPEGLSLPRELALALMTAKNKSTLESLIRGGRCGTPFCPTQGVFGMATCADPTSQALGVCINCAEVLKVKMDTIRAEGLKSLKDFKLTSVSHGTFAPSTLCSDCTGLCLANSKDGYNLYDTSDYVNKQGLPICFACFKEQNGLGTNQVVSNPDLHTPEIVVRLNSSVSKLDDTYKGAARDKTTAQREVFNAESIVLAAELYKVPLSISAARTLLRERATQVLTFHMELYDQLDIDEE
ncbi:hypothetical protein Q8F55_003709 [Vanrija albida]|uniref:Uncharacterized protein n=1 Tax=Vanrija albida TaxID=181172 RepID=A0ABR3Q5R8_9TREE